MSFDKKHIQLLLMLGALTACGPFSIDMYLPALPVMAEHLGTTLAITQYSLAVFFLGLSLGQLFYGPIADRFGRRAPLFAGLGIFVLASFGCALAPSVEWLIFFRFLQALGCCAGIVISRAAVRDLFDRQDAARVFSSLMLVMGVAPILAPIVGAYINDHAGWRIIFHTLVVMGLALMAVAYYHFDETHKLENRHTLLSFRNSISTYAALLRDRHFMGYALAGSLGQAGLFVYITASPFVLIELYGVSPTHYAWIFGANAAGLIGASQLNRVLLKEGSIDGILAKAWWALAIFSFLLLVLVYMQAPLLWVLAALFGYISTLGITFPNSSAGALAHQGRQAGSASALLGSLQFLIAFAVSGAVSLLHDHTAVPMAALMLTMSLLALISYRLMVGNVLEDSAL